LAVLPCQAGLVLVQIFEGVYVFANWAEQAQDVQLHRATHGTLTLLADRHDRRCRVIARDALRLD
jgi:hypothetical protein